MDTVYSFGQLKDLLAPVFLRNNVRKAVLFGSYGKGAASPKSDVDLFVDSGLRGLDFFGLVGEAADAAGKTVDVIDVTEVVPGSRIEKEIGATGVLIYEK
jgi:predicted nucleotidyltransferase